MNERRQLLLLSGTILAAVSLSAVFVTSIHFYLVAAEQQETYRRLLSERGVDWSAEGQLPLLEPVARSAWLAAAKTVVIVIAGCTLLLRVTNPFVTRLEATVKELRRTTSDLKVQAAGLERINRELDDFTYIASHDLKEPLRGISSYCQILRDDYQSEIDADGQRRLNALVSLCARLEQLIDDLLAYSQIGRKPHASQRTDLNVLLFDILEILGPAIDQRRGQVVRRGDLPVVVADPTLVGEVLRNLIANGLKFNESPRPTVEVGALPGDPASTMTTIFVRDNGIGIEVESHEAIFAMFRRLHSRRKYEGTGAGLTFAKKIVEGHGGRMWLESQAGQGTTFYFTLPSKAQTTFNDPSAAPQIDCFAHEWTPDRQSLETSRAAAAVADCHLPARALLAETLA